MAAKLESFNLGKELTLSQTTKFLDLSKLKAFADNKVNVS